MDKIEWVPALIGKRPMHHTTNTAPLILCAYSPSLQRGYRTYDWHARWRNAPGDPFRPDMLAEGCDYGNLSAAKRGAERWYRRWRQARMLEKDS